MQWLCDLFFASTRLQRLYTHSVPETSADNTQLPEQETPVPIKVFAPKCSASVARAMGETTLRRVKALVPVGRRSTSANEESFPQIDRNHIFVESCLHFNHNPEPRFHSFDLRNVRKRPVLLGRTSPPALERTSEQTYPWYRALCKSICIRINESKM